MTKKELSDFEIDISGDESLFVISIVSRMIGIPVWTLRKIDEMGIVCPKRIGKKTRCYSQKQIKKLSYIFYLINEEGINLTGIKFILQQRKEGEMERTE
jgi:MerR family transcriptional regulator, heat shock protein HspR